MYLKHLINTAGIKIQLCEKNSLIIPHIFPIRILNGKRDYIKMILNKNNLPGVKMPNSENFVWAFPEDS